MRIRTIMSASARCVPWMLAASLVLAVEARAAEGPHVLSETGPALGTMSTTGDVDDLRFTVDLQGDVPAATYVWVTVGSSDRRMRSNEGYWLPWNGDRDLLVDNHFPVVDGKVDFKVLDENLGTDNQGVSISIGYRVGEAIKYGTFAIHPKAGTP